MKKILSLLLPGLILISSCRYFPVGAEWEEHSMTEAAALSAGMQDSLTIFIEFQTPAKTVWNNGKAETAVILEGLFGSDYRGMTPDKAMETFRDSAITDYRQTNLPLTEMTATDGNRLTASMLNWEIYKTGRVSSYYKDIHTYLIEDYVFSGGAHGISRMTALNFRTKDGSLIHAEDIFADDCEERLAELLLLHLNDGKDSDNKISLLYDIVPNGNFIIGDDGITFIFNPYEIAAYSFGIIEVTIPAEEVRDCLRKGTDLY